MEKIASPGGVTCYKIVHKSGAEITVARHGGHLISWKTADGIERLYLSERAEFSDGKAIRGGVPVIFPQFNENGPYPRHGFARKAEWTADCKTGTLILCASDKTRAVWPHDFELSIQFQLSDSALEIEMAVKNTGQSAFKFQAALHSYFATADITNSKVTGLENLDFENEVTDSAETSEPDGIQFGTEIDRAYQDAGRKEIGIESDSKNQGLIISSENFPDFVVWNPGPDHGIGDLPDDGWRNFVCVESAQVQNGEPLQPGETWIGKQKIRVA